MKQISRKKELNPSKKRRGFLKMTVLALGSLFTPKISFAKKFWPIRSVEKKAPPFNPETWRITIDGLVENPMIFSFEEFIKLPNNTTIKDLHCVEGWSVKNIAWQGVRLKTLIDMVQPQTHVKFLTFYCTGDIYSESLSIEQALHLDVMLAYNADSRPLTPDHGAPLRLVVPHLWGYKSAKWVEHIEFVESRQLGYWSLRGYRPDAGPELDKK